MIRLLFASLVLVCSCAPVLGDAPPFTPLKQTPLQEALNDSIARSRLLIVVLSGPNTDRAKRNAAPWNNPTLDAWVRLHAVAVHVTDKETFKQLSEGSEGELKATDPETPMVFRDGKKVRLFGSGAQGAATRLRTPPREAPKWAVDAPNCSLRLLLKLDWTLRAAAKDDPDWWTRHEQANPPPEPPAPRVCSSQPAAGVEAFAPPAGHPDVLAIFADAQSAAAEEKTRAKATGMLTYLWEFAAAVEPGSSPALLFAIASRMHELARAHPPARSRFAAMRDADAALIPWMSHEDLFKWLLLSRVIDEHLEALDFIDSALSDSDGVLMMPQGDRLAWELLLPRLNWADALSLPSTGDPEKYLSGLARRIDGKPPERVGEKEWPALLETLGFLFAAEIGRIHSALLGAAKPTEQSDAAFDVLAAHKNDPAAVAGAIGLAIAHGRADPRHRAALEGGPGRAWPGLKGAVERALKK